MYLQKAFLTGILRITKESLFSKLNNVDTMTYLDENIQNNIKIHPDSYPFYQRIQSRVHIDYIITGRYSYVCCGDYNQRDY